MRGSGRRLGESATWCLRVIANRGSYSVRREQRMHMWSLRHRECFYYFILPSESAWQLLSLPKISMKNLLAARFTTMLKELLKH